MASANFGSCRNTETTVDFKSLVNKCKSLLNKSIISENKNKSCPSKSINNRPDGFIKGATGKSDDDPYLPSGEMFIDRKQ